MYVVRVDRSCPIVCIDTGWNPGQMQGADFLLPHSSQASPYLRLSESEWHSEYAALCTPSVRHNMIPNALE